MSFCDGSCPSLLPGHLAFSEPILWGPASVPRREWSVLWMVTQCFMSGWHWMTLSVYYCILYLYLYLCLYIYIYLYCILYLYLYVYLYLYLYMFIFICSISYRLDMAWRLLDNLLPPYITDHYTVKTTWHGVFHAEFSQDLLRMSMKSLFPALNLRPTVCLPTVKEPNTIIPGL